MSDIKLHSPIIISPYYHMDILDNILRNRKLYTAQPTNNCYQSYFSSNIIFTSSLI